MSRKPNRNLAKLIPKLDSVERSWIAFTYFHFIGQPGRYHGLYGTNPADLIMLNAREVLMVLEYYDLEPTCDKVAEKIRAYLDEEHGQATPTIDEKGSGIG